MSRRAVLLLASSAVTLLTMLGLGGQAGAQQASRFSPSSGTTSGNRHVISASDYTGSFYSPVSTMYLYVPQSHNDVRLTLTYASGSISMMSVRIAPNCTAPVNRAGFNNSRRQNQYYVVNPVTNYLDTGVVPNQRINDFVRISNDQPTASMTINGVVYNVYCAQVSTDADTNVFFKLSTNAGALLGTYPGASNALGTGYANSQTDYNALNTWSQQVSFSAPCNASGSGAISLYDMDTYQTANSGMRVRLKRERKDGTGTATYLSLTGDIASGNSNGYTLSSNQALGDADSWRYYSSWVPRGWYTPPAPVGWGTTGNGPNNVVDSTEYPPPATPTRQRLIWNVSPSGFTYDDQHIYTLEVNDIGPWNLIRIKLPYDQINASVTCPPPTRTITGTVYNAYQHPTRYRDITINTCVTGVSATTDANGRFSFTVNAGQAFCVRLDSDTLPAGAVAGGQRVRPWRVVSSGSADDYAGCAASTSLSNPMGYCSVSGSGSYECQIAGTDAGVQPGCGSPRDLDRASDTGFDFVIRFRPQLSCTLTSGSLVEVGSSYQPQVTVRNDGIAARPAITAGTVTVTVGATTRSWTYATDTATGRLATSTSRASTASDLAAVTLADAGRYPVAATAAATGDGLDLDPTPVSCAGGYDQLAGVLPYLKEFGGDVWTGGNFAYVDNTCAAPAGSPGNAFGFAEPAGPPVNGSTPYRGMSTQLTLTALMNINGVYSASHRDPSAEITTYNAGSPGTLVPARTYPPKGLTFANTGSGQPDSTFGGGFSPDGRRCITNYFDNTRDTTLAQPGPFTPTALPAGRSQYSATGNRTLAGFPVPVGSQTALYVDGDVYINGDITLADGAAGLDQLPYFALIVRGDIHVAAHVTRLDGLYVAQPYDSGSRGTIYTCSRNSGGSYRAYTTSSDPALDIFSNCDRQLSINGSVVAARIKWLRITASLRDATAAEAPDFATGHGTNASEIVNYTPQMWLAPSPLRSPGDAHGTTGPAGRYDAIQTMPPVF